ncbi:MAG: hypothetical protein K0S55_155, partial [Clostridia bacterium]|nr:hypothetical protein [Clostridia bacterium]
MSKLDVRLHEINTRRNGGYWADRIAGQLSFGIGLSQIFDCKYDQLLIKTEDFILGMINKEGCISEASSREAEEMI